MKLRVGPNKGKIFDAEKRAKCGPEKGSIAHNKGKKGKPRSEEAKLKTAITKAATRLAKLTKKDLK